MGAGSDASASISEIFASLLTMSIIALRIARSSALIYDPGWIKGRYR